MLRIDGPPWKNNNVNIFIKVLFVLLYYFFNGCFEEQL